MVTIESVEVTLGERAYTVQEAGFLRARPWKKRLIEEVQPIFNELSGAQELTFASAADLLQLMPLAERLFVDALDLVFELLIEYSPALEAERAYIEEHATDKQIMAAFQEVVRLADPFGMVQQLTRRLGRTTSGPSSSSPAANGAVASPKPQPSQTPS